MSPEGGIVVFLLRDLIVKSAGEFKIDRVFSSFEILVIVDVPLTPELSLVVEDLAAFVQGSVFGTPEDAIGVVFFWSLKGGEIRVVVIQSLSVVVPVNGHCEGIGNESPLVGRKE